MFRWRAALAAIATIASCVHERLDGSGYHRGIRGPEIPVLGRYLGAADVYHAWLEDRPYRGALQPQEAAVQLRREARDARLDGAAMDAVRGVSGQRSSGAATAPAGLTPREVEVLLLVARGATTRHVARMLNIKPKSRSRTPALGAPGKWATLAIFARAGLPDHSNRNLPDHSAGSSGPLTATWHARPLSVPRRAISPGSMPCRRGPEITAASRSSRHGDNA